MKIWSRRGKEGPPVFYRIPLLLQDCGGWKQGQGKSFLNEVMTWRKVGLRTISASLASPVSLPFNRCPILKFQHIETMK